MRMLQRLNPGPGLADFWTEFKRPNPYRWRILGASALLTAGLMYLLSDHAFEFNLVVAGVLALLAGVVVVALVQEHFKPNWHVVVVAAALTGLIMYQFTLERVVVPPPPPEVDFITTFEPGRTDAEILASNRANQARQERLRAEQAEREEQAREAYRALGRASGLDVDEMERRIREQEARDAAAAARGGSVAQPAR